MTKTYEGYKLTYAQAKLIIWNPDSYASNIVRQAAVVILGSLSARQEDLDQAASVI